MLFCDIYRVLCSLQRRFIYKTLENSNVGSCASMLHDYTAISIKVLGSAVRARARRTRAAQFPAPRAAPVAALS